MHIILLPYLPPRTQMLALVPSLQSQEPENASFIHAWRSLGCTAQALHPSSIRQHLPPLSISPLPLLDTCASPCGKCMRHAYVCALFASWVLYLHVCGPLREEKHPLRLLSHTAGSIPSLGGLPIYLEAFRFWKHAYYSALSNSHSFPDCSNPPTLTSFECLQFWVWCGFWMRLKIRACFGWDGGGF
jgi:hypothetical protein